uniref:Adipokinetic hormone novel isoform 2 n=1 Tax=Spodoptera frugiperda TaxID=7108 RepID=A0ZWH7_SPOFR|nr:adipokinetic hormone novel isoform 2 precursor [Spodoptera frugiperda]CAI38852.2 adipokinetic hormone novel isoform 3 precursor [Spodoptera frugiperda]
MISTSRWKLTCISAALMAHTGSTCAVHGRSWCWLPVRWSPLRTQLTFSSGWGKRPLVDSHRYPFFIF